MIEITNKENCCGCSACEQICPVKCIEMRSDTEGFIYPFVEASRCIDCHRCESVCPILNSFSPQDPKSVYAAINLDEEVRKQSSSGGIFSLLADEVLKEGGVVFGARFDEEWQVELGFIDKKEDIGKFRGSKYVQANPHKVFTEARDFLKQGRKVLFSGTPCQVAGLKHFLGRDYENLTTVDFICHGVPSPYVWHKYVQELSSSKRIGKISFRDKSKGWNHFGLRIEDKKSRLIYKNIFQDDPYMQLFLNNYILRPSCHDCRARKGSSASDITLADFWNIEKVMPEKLDDKGISLVLCNSEKGKDILNTSGLELHVVNHDVIIKYNKAWYESYQVPYKRNEILKEVLHSKVKDVYIKHFHPEFLLKNRIKNLISRTVDKVKNMF